MPTYLEPTFPKWCLLFLVVMQVLVARGAADEQINVDETGWQQDPMVGRAADGRTVYVWDDGSPSIRLYDASGLPQSETEISLPGISSKPDLTVHDDGRFVVVWTSYVNTVHGQRLTANGELDGSQFLVNSTQEGLKNHVDIAAQPDHGFAVVWEAIGADGSQSGIVGRVFDGMGQAVTSDFLINTQTLGVQKVPQVGSDDQGNFLVVWNSSSNPTPGIWGRWMDPGGTPLEDEFLVAEAPPSPDFVYYATVAVADGGGALVVWLREEAGVDIIRGRFYDGSGAASDVMDISTFNGQRKDLPQVAADDSTGEFFVVWESRDQDAGGAGVFGRRVGADGVPLGDEIGLSDITLGNQGEPAVAYDGSGSLALVWQSPDSDGPGIFGNCLQADGCSPVPIFGDGFESGNTSVWSNAVP